MKSNAYAGIVMAVALALAGTSCSSSDSKKAESSSSAASAGETGQADDARELASLIPAPANAQTTKGPDNIGDNGIHLFFKVTGSPVEVMEAFKTELEGKKWDIATVVASDGSEGGGATYAGSNGLAYGVFDGGGYQNNTFIDVCAWPAKPAKPTCNRGDR